MPATRHRSTAFALAGLITLGLAPLSAPASAAPAGPSCLDSAAPVGVEEQRLGRTLAGSDVPVSAQILDRSGFGGVEVAFVRDLCNARSLAHSERVAERHGAQLWRDAAARAQGQVVRGDLPAGDDRPLYWARLQMSRALQQYAPGFEFSESDRTELLEALATTSRGRGEEIRLPAGEGVRTMLVSGFDPFILDTEPRRTNPSGASALALDGTTVQTDKGRVRIEAVVLPVNWTEFEQGMVEDTFGPLMRPGSRQLDATMTISQGRNRFDSEQYNGRFGTGTGNDGYNPCAAPFTIRPACQNTPSQAWVPFEPPQFTETNQPVEVMAQVDVSPYTFNRNTEVTEFVDCDGTATIVSLDGPSSPQACARSGGGGDYLSNAVAYRVTLLRDALGLDTPAGHLHIPPVSYEPGNANPNGPAPQITDPEFERTRTAVVERTVALVRAAAAETLRS